MSTVIWTEGVMYSDSQVTYNSVNYNSADTALLPEDVGKAEKIFRVDGKVYGVCGSLQGWENFKHFKGTWHYGTVATICAVIEDNGTNVYTYEPRQKKIFGRYFMWWKRTKIDFNKITRLVMGSGEEHAMGALRMGLTPVEAIKYASDRDAFTDDEVKRMSVYQSF